jgi:hypothetical protein
MPDEKIDIGQPSATLSPPAAETPPPHISEVDAVNVEIVPWRSNFDNDGALLTRERLGVNFTQYASDYPEVYTTPDSTSRHQHGHIRAIGMHGGIYRQSRQPFLCAFYFLPDV